ncbi:hypothetical protein BU24DRAFT_212109 [Aaosphaeria arxii CBS 175.79]|uniref:Uncharacterized protein n=1 Tax=Aaosphaeria arxii CBS 175.79 TaxID=1450172 RepID=A0A6A5XLX0_9PLEO|nr:uncharacterized protein BU24DRAFT_212109 [Aaosphaeria arxii CBS 175.79]KAF2014235.1 hypothetical protein BU24DRAFT_212109 [Aaosphaeria arxii CBS 175.79]
MPAIIPRTSQLAPRGEDDRMTSSIVGIVFAGVVPVIIVACVVTWLLACYGRQRACGCLWMRKAQIRSDEKWQRRMEEDALVARRKAEAVRIATAAGPKAPQHKKSPSDSTDSSGKTNSTEDTIEKQDAISPDPMPQKHRLRGPLRI